MFNRPCEDEPYGVRGKGLVEEGKRPSEPKCSVSHHGGVWRPVSSSRAGVFGVRHQEDTVAVLAEL